MIRSLEEQNVQRLYPQQYGKCKSALGSWFYLTIIILVIIIVVFLLDKKAELKKLNRSILICFLELLDILIDNPSSPEVRIQGFSQDFY